MDVHEARQVASARLAGLRRLSYEDLRASPASERVEQQGPSGATYQVVTQTRWDDEDAGHLRVVVLVDDGGRRVLYPVSVDFIIAPDGTFVGE